MSHIIDHAVVEPLMTDIRGAARMLHISPVTIRNWIYRGYMPIPSFRLRGRRLFRVADIRAYVDAGCVWPGASTDDPQPPRRGLPRRVRS